MSRAVAAAVVAALALPVLALAALIGQQEWTLASAKTLNVPLRGYDPRDLLRGHYIFGLLDWDWEGEPVSKSAYQPVEGALCVLATASPKPRVRFLPQWKSGDRVDAECRLIVTGRGWPSGGGRTPARFVPSNLDNGGGSVKFFVAEERGPELEKIIRERPGALTVDLAVRSDGSAAIRALRLDGKLLGR